MRCDVTTLLYSYSSLENEYIHHPTIRRQPPRPGVLSAFRDDLMLKLSLVVTFPLLLNHECYHHIKLM